MRHFAKRAQSLVRSALVACVISSAAPAVAQEADLPTLPDVGEGRGGLVAPSAWLVLNTPVDKPIDLKVYGFYIGELGIPVGQVDVPIRAARFLTITPSYMGYRASASGLNDLTPEPGPFTDSYHEHQFRIDGTVTIPVRKLEVSVRNMYVRRFRPDLDDVNRYRGRISFAHPLTVGGKHPEAVRLVRGVLRARRRRNKDRLWTGFTLPITSPRPDPALLHVRGLDRQPRRPLPVVRPDRQHAIGPRFIVKV